MLQILRQKSFLIDNNSNWLKSAAYHIMEQEEGYQNELELQRLSSLATCDQSISMLDEALKEQGQQIDLLNDAFIASDISSESNAQQQDFDFFGQLSVIKDAKPNHQFVYFEEKPELNEQNLMIDEKESEKNFRRKRQIYQNDDQELKNIQFKFRRNFQRKSQFYDNQEQEEFKENLLLTFVFENPQIPRIKGHII